MLRLLVVLMTASFMLGCNQGNERLAEKARIEGKESATAELQAQLDAKDQLIEKARAEGKAAAEAELATQNSNLEIRSKEMEADLAQRHRFYQAVAGTYEGDLQTAQGKFKVRLKVVPTVAPYVLSRTRLLEEVAFDINNLHFNVQVVEWNPANPLSGVGCRVEGIRPDLNRGEFVITKDTCPSLYVLKLSDGKSGAMDEPKPDEINVRSGELAREAQEGKLDEVVEIRGEKQPTTNPTIYSFKAKRLTQ